MRTPCCIPFCRRTTAHPFKEWICGDHWKLIPPRMKKRHRVAQRLAERAGERFNEQYSAQHGFTDRQLARAVATARLASQIWTRCKAAAIEASGGIG